MKYTSNLESNSPNYFQYMLVKTFITFVLKILILRLRPTTEGQSLTGLNIQLRPKVKITTMVQHWQRRKIRLISATDQPGRKQMSHYIREAKSLLS